MRRTASDTDSDGIRNTVEYIRRSCDQFAKHRLAAVIIYLSASDKSLLRLCTVHVRNSIIWTGNANILVEFQLAVMLQDVDAVSVVEVVVNRMSHVSRTITRLSVVSELSQQSMHEYYRFLLYFIIFLQYLWPLSIYY